MKRLYVILALIATFGLTLVAIAIKRPSIERFAACIDTQEQKDLLDKLDKETDLTSPYSVSIPLLASALLNDKALYEKWKMAMLQAFQARTVSNPTERAWLLGRLLIASLRMGDKEEAKQTSFTIEQLLKNAPADPYAAWAWGYLAAYYAEVKPEEFLVVKVRMIDSTNQLMAQPEEQGKDNVPWAIIMELQSLADRKEEKTYNERIEQWKQFTKTTSVLDALKQIPPDDFRAWAASLTWRAAYLIGDKPLEKELSKELANIISKSPSDADRLLAALVRCNL